MEEINKSLSAEEYMKVLRERVKYFISKNHPYEANELTDAIETITRLVPPDNFEDKQAFKGKTAEEIAIWNGCDNHPELEECIQAMEEYSNLKLKEEIKGIIAEVETKSNTFDPAFNNGMKRVIEILKKKL